MYFSKYSIEQFNEDQELEDEINIDKLPDDLKKYLELDERSDSVSDELEQLRDDLYMLGERQREQGYDGEDDPLAGKKNEAQELQWVLDRYVIEMDKLESNLSPASKAIFDRVVEDAQGRARYAAEDRHTRRQESGCY